MAETRGPGNPADGGVSKRLVVLVSGSGSNLQALIDACADPAFGAHIVAVGADRDGVQALARAERAGIPAFVLRVKDFPTREAWDAALAEEVAAHEPDLVISAGFMKLVGEAFLNRFLGRMINTHPALLPAFPGMHGVRDALEFGVKLTGCTVFFVDAGVDTGPIIAQAVVPVADDDDEETLHERIKTVERGLLTQTVGRLVRDGYRIEGRRVQIP